MDTLLTVLWLILAAVVGVLLARLFISRKLDPKKSEVNALREQHTSALDGAERVLDEQESRRAAGWRLKWHQPSRRAPTLADPRAAYFAAVDALKSRNQRLSKTAMAVEMGIDRGTLKNYIENYDLPYPPV
jgi:hypothetical protein